MNPEYLSVIIPWLVFIGLIINFVRWEWVNELTFLFGLFIFIILVVFTIDYDVKTNTYEVLQPDNIVYTELNKNNYVVYSWGNGWPNIEQLSESVEIEKDKKFYLTKGQNIFRVEDSKPKIIRK